MEQLLRYKEAAALLRISKPTLERRVKAGKIEVVRLGAPVRFTMAALEKYVAESSKVKTRMRKEKIAARLRGDDFG